MSTIPSFYRNVSEIAKLEEEALRSRSPVQRLGDAVASQAGRLWFIQFHVVWFGLWILGNSGRIPGILRFDPFPFPLLTLVVSLEAIFLSLFILMSQNGASRQADRRAQLDLQINLLAELESSKTLELLQALCRHHRLPCADDPEVSNLICRTRPDEILNALRQTLPSEERPESPRIVSP